MNDSDRDVRRNPRGLGPAVLAFVAIVVTALAVLFYRVGRPYPMGTFTSTGPTLGDWTMNVDVCHTGSRRNFAGAQFYSTKDKRLGVWMIEDPLRGLITSVNSTSTHDSVNIAPAQCAVLTGRAKDTSSSLHPPAMIAGEYTVDCTVDQSHLTGHVVFENCL